MAQNFLSILFDLSFDRYLTIRIVQVAYAFCIAIAGLGALLQMAAIWWLFSAMYWDKGLAVVLVFFWIPATSIGFLIFSRLWLEALVVHYKGYEKAAGGRSEPPIPQAPMGL